MNTFFGRVRRFFRVETADIRAVPPAIERFSVKTKVTLVAVLLFLLSLLLVSAIQFYYVKAEMKTLLAAQQLAFLSIKKDVAHLGNCTSITAQSPVLFPTLGGSGE